MISFRSLLVDTVVVIAAISVIYFVFHTYREPVIEYLFGSDKVGVFVHDIPLTVSIANTPEERRQGLSGVDGLLPQEGKLFIFEEDGIYGFWMKDMNFAVDIIWINSNLEVIHIEENVRPSTYPSVFTSQAPARFVLETNAFFAETFNINLGDKLTMPANRLPDDLKP